MNSNTDADVQRTEYLHFDISSGLKRVIGRDLITDDEVAIFELVKNSFDASATHVQLRFQNKALWIVDDGSGMSRGDLESKWLFVAYSAKSERNQETFREQIGDRRNFAGSKGIGRFSADRLGATLVVQTRSDPDDHVNSLSIDWDRFEKDDRQQFDKIEIAYETSQDFDLPLDLEVPKTGTALLITDTRGDWTRDKLLHLKSSLAKLINPFGSTVDGFVIEIIAPDELAEDEKYLADDGESRSTVVNGPVQNFIFSALQEKTTYVDVSLSADGSVIRTSLTDRGELVFRIEEPNPFQRLRTSGFTCQLFYLNQSAKLTFARRMGIPSVRFGSIFLFRNNFRVFPIGEAGDDWFGIDARKQQGYARYLGTRDVIGRIDVAGTEELFKEASSRDQGLVDTEASRDLQDLFWQHCFKRLEKYVVPVSWADKGEALSEDLSRLMTDAGRSRVTAAVARLLDAEGVTLIDYSKKLVAVINERSSQFESSLSGLRDIAAKTNNQDLLVNLEEAERRFLELKSAEAEALRLAEEQRIEKEEAQEAAREAEARTIELSAELEESKKRSILLTSLTSLDETNIVAMHHQITIYAGDLKQQIENCIIAVRKGSTNPTDMQSRLEQLAFINQKVLSVARLATKANFRLQSDAIEGDLGLYIEQYVDQAGALGAGKIGVVVVNDAPEFVRKFRPMEVSILVDNLVNNAQKAGASRISFVIRKADRSTLEIEVSDNGPGIPSSIKDPEDLFGLGFSRTSGSGLGLYHVRQVLGDMSGSIAWAPSDVGATFKLRITK